MWTNTKYALLSSLVASITVAPFIPHTQLVSNLAYGDLAVMVIILGLAAMQPDKAIAPALSLWPIVIGGIGVISLIVNYGLRGDDFSWSALGYLARWFYAGLLIFVIANISSMGERSGRAIIEGVLLGSIITAISGWVAWSQAPRYAAAIAMLHVIEGSDFIINRNYIGYFLSIGVVLAFSLAIIEPRKIRRLILYLTCTFMGFSALATMSKGTWLSAFLPILLYWAKPFMPTFAKRSLNIKHIVRLGFALAMLILILSTSYVNRYSDAVLDRIEHSDSTNAQRIQFVKDSAIIALENPILGVGPERYRHEAVALGLEPTEDPHNAIMWVAAELGLIAALILLCMLTFQGIHFIRYARLTELKIWLPIKMAYFSIMLQIPLQGLPISTKHLWILLGLAAGIHIQQRMRSI